MNRYIGISFKMGVLFSSIFLVMIFFLGYMLYSLFSQMFLDYVTQDLLNRGNNHAKILSETYDQTTIQHVVLMEQGVITSVVVTDGGQIIAYSDSLDDEVRGYIDTNRNVSTGSVLNRDWEQYKYIASVSPIQNGEKGNVFMLYPTDVLKNTVAVIKGFMAIVILGIIFITISIIGITSRRITKPMLEMREATNKMAKGDYIQNLESKGNDEIAQLGSSIQKLGEQLQYYENSRNDFLASVSHELRTPLTYIKGYSDVLIKGKIDSTEQRKYLKIISEEAERVARLVNDLLDFSKVQAGQIDLHKEKVAVDELIEKVIHHLEPIATKKNLEIVFKKEEKVQLLNLDPHRMEQVFYNLIENALKYTDLGKIEVSISQSKRHLIITISDTGIGIEEEELPRIWDRFYRVEKSRARKTGGTGLGLYIVKEIIQSHGGEIQIESKVGEGTKVIIKFKKSDVIT